MLLWWNKADDCKLRNEMQRKKTDKNKKHTKDKLWFTWFYLN